MAKGPGRYAVEARAASTATGAKLLLLIAIEGNKGTGFSAIIDPSHEEMRLLIPTLLRRVADDIEREQALEGH